MKGKSVFTKKEADEIIKLIEEKLKADSVAQKGIRAKIRLKAFMHPILVYVMAIQLRILSV